MPLGLLAYDVINAFSIKAHPILPNTNLWLQGVTFHPLPEKVD